MSNSCSGSYPITCQVSDVFIENIEEYLCPGQRVEVGLGCVGGLSAENKISFKGVLEPFCQGLSRKRKLNQTAGGYFCWNGLNPDVFLLYKIQLCCRRSSSRARSFDRTGTATHSSDLVRCKRTALVSKKLRVAPGITTRNKKPLVTRARSVDSATTC